MNTDTRTLKHKFLENFFSLTALRGLTLIVPLITYPYLIRVLGSEQYGLVMWAWSIVNLFVLFINFGFDLSVTKYISIHREDKVKVSEIVSTTLVTKNLLFLISFFFFLVLVNSVPKIIENRELFFYTFALTLGETMMPIWYFQGIEQMRYTAMITSFIKLGFTVLVFIAIKEQSDYLKVPILYAIASFVSAMFAYYLIFFRHGIFFIRPSMENIIFYIKDSITLFIMSGMGTMRDGLPILFVEHYAGLSFVAYYDIIMKFVAILITPFHIASSVIYPHMARTKSNILFRKMLYGTILISFILYIFIFIFSKNISILLTGEDISIFETGLLIMTLSIVVNSLSALYGINSLVIHNKQKKLVFSILISTIFFVLLMFFLENHMNFLVILASYVFILTVDMVLRVVYSRGKPNA